MDWIPTEIHSYKFTQIHCIEQIIQFSHKTFFGHEDVKIINSSKDNVLSILKEEETSDSESKSKEYLNKIHHLEESLKLSSEAQKQVIQII